MWQELTSHASLSSPSAHTSCCSYAEALPPHFLAHSCGVTIFTLTWYNMSVFGCCWNWSNKIRKGDKLIEIVQVQDFSPIRWREQSHCLESYHCNQEAWPCSLYSSLPHCCSHIWSSASVLERQRREKVQLECNLGGEKRNYEQNCSESETVNLLGLG